MAWVVRESVTNVVRHAKARHCTITLAPTPSVWLRVEDDGVGPNGVVEGNGLTGLRERIAPLEARLHVETAHPHGTRLEVVHG